MSHLPVLVIVIPIAGGFVLSVTDLVVPGLKRGTALVVAVAHSTVLVAAARSALLYGPMTYVPGSWVPPVGIALRIDSFTAFFLMLLAVGHTLAVLFRVGSVVGPRRAGMATAALTALLFGALSGIAVTADLFNLFVFVELATVCTVGLIARKQRPVSSVAGFVYLIVAAVSGALLLFAVLLIYNATGTVSMALVAQRIHQMPRDLHTVIVAAMVVSFGIKFGMVPFHLWQPRAYHAAGTTTAGVLSAFAMKVYLYALFRLLWGPLQVPHLLPAAFGALHVLALITILVGHTMALLENNLIRLLAFSSVAHGGYILLGLAAAGSAGSGPIAEAAIAAALFHIAMHALMKGALLWSGHFAIAAARSSRMMDHRGVARGTPITMTLMVGAFMVAALAIAGIPPTGGFVSKWLVALVQESLVPVLVIAVGTVISLGYYARYFIIVTARPLRDFSWEGGAGTPVAVAVVLVLAVAVAGAGFVQEPLQILFAGMARALLAAGGGVL